MAFGNKSSASGMVGHARTIFMASAAIMLAATAGCSAVADSNVKTASFSAKTSYADLVPTAKPKAKVVAARHKPTATKDIAKVASATPSYGNAPYICTPSGFGHLARCFART